MQFHMLWQDDDPDVHVYVNREDFDEAAREAVRRSASHAVNGGTDGIEKRILARTHTCETLNDVEAMLPPDDGDSAHWCNMGRSHDGSRHNWCEDDYRGGNAVLYREAAASLLTAGNETMAYSHKPHGGAKLARALSLDTIDPEDRVVTDEMAGSIAPSTVAATVAGHVVACAYGWQRYLNDCVRAKPRRAGAAIAMLAGNALGISTSDGRILFSAKPCLEEIEYAFNVKDEYWPCTQAEAEAIAERWGKNEYRAADMATVLEMLARRCDRVNAFIAKIDN